MESPWFHQTVPKEYLKLQNNKNYKKYVPEFIKYIFTMAVNVNIEYLNFSLEEIFVKNSH